MSSDKRRFLPLEEKLFYSLESSQKQTFSPLLGYFFFLDKINQKSRNKPIWPTSRCILNHFFKASSENTKKSPKTWNVFFFVSMFHQGQYFSGNDHRVYLLGNPVIWWGNLVLLAVFLLAFAVNAVREQRGADQLQEAGDRPETWEITRFPNTWWFFFLKNELNSSNSNFANWVFSQKKVFKESFYSGGTLAEDALKSLITTLPPQSQKTIFFSNF